MTKEEAINILNKSTECYSTKVCTMAETCDECPLYVSKDEEYEAHKIAISFLENTDLSNYSDKLWKLAFERGKKETLKNIRVEISMELEKVYMYRDYANGLGKALEIVDNYISGKEEPNELL